MKNHEIRYAKRAFASSPLTGWVHRPVGDTEFPIGSAPDQVFDPPLPKPVGGKGWPKLFLHIDGVELQFSSTAEIHHFIEIMSQNPMPNIRKMYGSSHNRHWLSRLPKKAKSQKHRTKTINYLLKVLPEYESLMRY